MDVITSPNEIRSCVEVCKEMYDRTKTGEFSSIYILAVRTDGAVMTKFGGQTFSLLEHVGILEMLKFDELNKTENAYERPA